MQAILDLYRDYGSADYIGEKVSQSEHMIQCALLAESVTSDSDVILACLFHDIGQLVATSGQLLESTKKNCLGNRDHEIVGANYLRQLGFNEKICWLVQNHVLAKRYLVSTQPTYFETLSEASKQTYILQGAHLSPKEIATLEQQPYFKDVLLVRSLDDRAKVPNLSIPDITYFQDLIETSLP